MTAAVAGAQTQVLTLDGESSGAQHGRALACVGDIDGDGIGDLAIGAPLELTATGPTGRVRVVSGRTHVVVRTFDGQSAGERFGWSLASAGDLDGDGRNELIVGAPYWNGGAGCVAVYDGASGALVHHIAGTYPTSFVGWSVAGGGEVDGDGVLDFLVGEPQTFYSGNYHGHLRVYSGATGELILRQQEGGPLGRFRMGYAAAFLGDIDGDGFDEYVAGAPGEGSISAPGVCAYDGASGQLLWEVVGPAGGSEFGASLARLGDIDGDGVSELAVGAPETACASPCTGAGSMTILSGASGALVRTHLGAHAQAAFGRAITGMHDLDGDGLAEYAVAQPGASLGAANDFSVVVFAGTGSVLAELAPPQAPIGWGAALAAGDATGDGLGDLVIGAPYADSSALNAGAVHAFTLVRAPATYCDAEANSLGCTPAIASSGTPSASLPSPFFIRATNLINNKSGLLFYGSKPRQTPFQGGHMCIVAPTKRTPIQSSGGSAGGNDCTGAFDLDFDARIRSGVDPLLVAGAEVFAQYWSRDPADASTTNLTDALAFYIQ